MSRYTFVWPYGVQSEGEGESTEAEAFLGASFNNWNPVKMNKRRGGGTNGVEFYLTLYIPEGKHYYKFLIKPAIKDSSSYWCYDVLKPTRDDGFGGRNNFLYISPSPPQSTTHHHQIQHKKNEQSILEEQQQPDSTFDDHKHRVVNQVEENDGDRSRAGKVDNEIATFVETINSKRDFYTTSSCAGRSIVFHKQENEKYNVQWLYVTHQILPSSTKILNAIEEGIAANQLDGEVWFKMEPPIIAIRCRNIQSAIRLLNIAKGSGLKNCGLRSVSREDGSAMVALVDTHHIETLVAWHNKKMVSDEYFTILAQHAKTKLQISRERFERLRLQLERSIVD